MAYKFRIPAEDEYLLAIGRAHFNFVTLEWCAVNMFVKLDPNGHAGIPPRCTAGLMSKLLKSAIDGASPPLSATLETRLRDFQGKFALAILDRNKLLHANPFTDKSGEQLLTGSGKEWPMSEVYNRARDFEAIAIDGSEVYHDFLLKERP